MYFDKFFNRFVHPSMGTSLLKVMITFSAEIFMHWKSDSTPSLIEILHISDYIVVSVKPLYPITCDLPSLVSRALYI